MNTLAIAFSPLTQYVRPRTQPADPLTWMSRQVSSGFQVAWDAGDRLRSGVEPLDKINKLGIAGLQAMELYWAGAETPRVGAISEHLWNINEFFGSAGFFGRVQEVTGYDSKTGELSIFKRSKFKAANIVFLAFGKTAEVAKLFKSLDLLPVAKFAAIDSTYFGGIASRLGGTSLIRTLGLNSLGGTKNGFVLLSAAYAILDNVVNLIDAKVWDAHTLAKIGLAVANDLGKMAIIMWFYWFTITWSFVAISASTSVIGLSKILFDSYTAKPLKV